MAQHDYVIDNGTGAAVRSDLNNALSAIVGQNSGATTPSTTYAYMFWADTTAGVMKQRNAANTAWVTMWTLDASVYYPGSTNVAITDGGTGASTAPAALTALGLTANGKSLVTAANYAAMRTLLSLVPGTDVQAFNALLADIAGLTVAGGDILYVDGSGDIVNLAKGSNDEVLTLASGIPSWAAAPGAAAIGKSLQSTTFNLTTGSASTTDITGFGFNPNVAIFIYAVNGSNDYNGIGGWVDGVDKAAWGTQGSGLAHISSNAIAAHSGASVYQTFAAFSITGGIRLVNTKSGSPTGTLTIKIIALRV